MHKIDQSGHGGIQLAGNVLGSQHHTQRHLPLDHGLGGNEGDEDIAQIVDEKQADALGLPQSQRFGFQLVSAHTDVFPLAALGLLNALDFDFLHGRHQFIQIVPLLGVNHEPFLILDAPLFQEQYQPADTQDGHHRKDRHDHPGINGQHHAEDDKCEDGKHHIQRRGHEETFYPLVIPDPLHDIACGAGVEKLQRQPQQLS